MSCIIMTQVFWKPYWANPDWLCAGTIVIWWNPRAEQKGFRGTQIPDFKGYLINLYLFTYSHSFYGFKSLFSFYFLFFTGKHGSSRKYGVAQTNKHRSSREHRTLQEGTFERDND